MGVKHLNVKHKSLQYIFLNIEEYLWSKHAEGFHKIQNAYTVEEKIDISSFEM